MTDAASWAQPRATRSWNTPSTRAARRASDSAEMAMTTERGRGACAAADRAFTIAFAFVLASVSVIVLGTCAASLDGATHMHSSAFDRRARDLRFSGDGTDKRRRTGDFEILCLFNDTLAAISAYTLGGGKVEQHLRFRFRRLHCEAQVRTVEVSNVDALWLTSTHEPA